MSLADQLEHAAEALPAEADAIRPANGDPQQLLASLDADAAARVLAWLLANAPDAASELALAWLDEPEGAAVVSAIDEGTLPKAGRKTLRRVLHTARSRGLVVEKKESAPTRVARLPDVDQAISGAYVSPLDPRGARLVYLVESSPAGGAHVFEALLDRHRGIVDFQLYRAGRRQVREFVRDVTGRKGGFAAVEAEPGAVRALIARAAERHPASRPFPKPFSEWRTRLTRGAEHESTPGERVRAALGGEPAGEGAVERLVAAVRAREVGPWPPAPELLEKAIADLRERAEADRERADGELKDWTAEVLRGLYAGDCAVVTAERFEECAYVYWRRGEEDEARACLATAGRLREGSGAEAPVVEALCELLADALATDIKQSLGIGAADGTGSESATPAD